MKKISSRVKADSDFQAKKNPYPDPIAYKDRESSYEGNKPTKEQATTGRFMQMGDDYGVGYRTPLGKEEARPINQGPIRFGKQMDNELHMTRKP